MDAYLKLVQNLAQEFDCFALTRILRSENVQADVLAALASSSDPILKRLILVEFIEHPSIGPPIVVNLIGYQDDDIEEVAGQPEERSATIHHGWKQFEPTSQMENYLSKNGRPAKSECRPRVT